LVGRGGAGKTSLVRRLVTKVFSPHQQKTDGIEITSWKLKIKDENIRLNIWDFGGQEIMHSTHQFFLTKRSLYLLVVNAREGEQDTNLEYWLRLIESFGGDSPIIVVINKISQHAFDVNRRGIQRKFPTIKAFVQTDCETDVGMEDLRAVIQRETDQLEHVRDLFPEAWFRVKDILGNIKRTEKRDFISFPRYQEICIQNGIGDTVGQETPRWIPARSRNCG